MAVHQRVPLLKYLIFIILGSIASSHFVSNGLWTGFIVLTIGTILLDYRVRRRSNSRLRVLAGIFLLMSFSLLICILGMARHPSSLFDPHLHGNAAIVGLVRSDPRLSGRFIAVDIRVLKLNLVHIGDEQVKLRVYLPPSDTLPEIGDALILYGRISRIRNRDSTSAFDYERYMQRKGILYQLYAVQHESVIASERYVVSRMVSRWRHWIEQRIDRNFDGRVRAWIKAIIVGDRNSLDPATRSDFRRAGASHIMAISGLHVGIVYLLLLQLFALVRTPWLQNVLIIIGILCYAGIASFTPSVVRAALMISVLQLGRSWGGRGSPLNALALAGVILICVEPDLIYDIGFQLSFMAVAGILIGFKPMQRRLRSRYDLVNRFIDLGVVGCAAQIFTLPLVLFHFGEYPLYGLLTNYLILPFVPFVIYGTTALLVSSIPSIDQALHFMIDAHVRFILFTAERLAAMPGAVVEVADFNQWHVLGYYFALLGFGFTFKLRDLRWGLIGATLAMMMNLFGDRSLKPVHTVIGSVNIDNVPALVIEQGEYVIVLCADVRYDTDIRAWLMRHHGDRNVIMIPQITCSEELRQHLLHLEL